ncbi:DUF3000 domain-containing protein [Kocuria sp. JC486]|uniref:DUF3000 family protein n=1 Tax=Kocuria sp. JC486 TaxID=1970736 RepID=UPI00142407A5|nr:DUF3000 domain-containing protein [Kocuria sp. JC486]
MSAVTDLHGGPSRFRSATASLRGAQCRPEIELTEIPVPMGPSDAVAFSATVADATAAIGRREPGELATGRFILSYDPSRKNEWGGSFRIVTYVKAQVERDLGHDQLLASVAWSWLLEALDRNGAGYTREGGTASRVLAEGFGQLADTGEDIDVELRASWTPADEDFGKHLEAWADMVCTFGGLPPVTDGVVSLTGR